MDLNFTSTTAGRSVGQDNAYLFSLLPTKLVGNIQHAIYYAILLFLIGYIGWQYLLRTGALWNSKAEPPMLPYLLPGNYFLVDN
jgi:hypothetical protein